MKRIAVWAFYVVGALAIGYLALHAYAVFTGRDLQPGDPIHIFRKPDAPSYSKREAIPNKGDNAIALSPGRVSQPPRNADSLRSLPA